MGRSVHNVKKNTEALVNASKDIGLEIKPSTWPCLQIRMQGEVTIPTNPLKVMNNSNIWEQT